MRRAAAGANRWPALTVPRPQPRRCAQPPLDRHPASARGRLDRRRSRGSAIVIPEQRYTNGFDLTDLMILRGDRADLRSRPAPHSTSAEKESAVPAAASGTAESRPWRPCCAAAHHATKAWDRRYDLYACLNSHGLTTATPSLHTALTAPLRHLVDGGNLLEFNDTHTGRRRSRPIPGAPPSWSSSTAAQALRKRPDERLSLQPGRGARLHVNSPADCWLATDR